VISLSGIVYARSLRIAGNHMDEAITEHVRRKHALIIGERTAEKIKVRIGSAARLDEPRTMEAKGRDLMENVHLMENVPKSVVLDDCEIRAALNEPVSTIMSAIRGTLERIPPELSGDIVERGIVLTGGGALLQEMDQRVRDEIGLPVSMAEDPTCSVVLGAGKVLEDFPFLRRVEVA
jgi:rod shape-determining protein MreB and related proteins